MSNKITKEQVIATLSEVVYPGSRENVIASGGVISIELVENNITIVLEIPKGFASSDVKKLHAASYDALMRLKGVGNVQVVLTAHEGAPISKEERRAAMKEQNRERRLTELPPPVEGVRKIVLVASGKGGVGKSTLAANLAVAMAKRGKSVGLVDADIYGPSIPTMFGTHEKPELSEDRKILPITRHGVQTMSMGYLVDENKAAVWRGSMASKALHQLIRLVKWGAADEPLDVLFIDTPPGTGDIHISLAERYAIDGVIMVCTPQDVAIKDMQKAVDMYRLLNVPIFGVVENMSYFADPVSGHKNYIFGEKGGARFAEKYGLPFLGEIPLVPAIREGGDAGVPHAVGEDKVYGELLDGVLV